MVNADTILKCEDLPRERVAVPEWGGADAHVYIRAMSAAERDAWEGSLLTGEGEARTFNQHNVRARLVVLCMVNEKGERIFAESQAEALGKKSAKVIGRLFEVAQRLNGIGAQYEEQIAKP